MYLFPIIVCILARDNTSAVIEVRLRPKHARWRYNMDVFADNKRIYFDRPSLRVQHFPGLDFKVIVLYIDLLFNIYNWLFILAIN